MGWKYSNGGHSSFLGDITKFKLIGNSLSWLIVLAVAVIVTGQSLDNCLETDNSKCCMQTNNACPSGYKELKVSNGFNTESYCRQSTTSTVTTAATVTTGKLTASTTNVNITTKSNSTVSTSTPNVNITTKSSVTTVSETDTTARTITENSTESNNSITSNDQSDEAENWNNTTVDETVCVENCPDGYSVAGNNSKCVFNPPEENDYLAAIIGGAVGGVVFIVVVIVIVVCCCRRNQGCSDEENTHKPRKRRPLSVLIYLKKKPKQPNADSASDDRNRTLRPAPYENIANPNPSALATGAQRQLDEKTRYQKDPTAKNEEPEIKKESLYENRSAIKLQELQTPRKFERSAIEEEEVKDLPDAPPIPPPQEAGAAPPILRMDTHPNRELQKNRKPKENDFEKQDLPATPKISNYMAMSDSRKDLTEEMSPKEHYENIRFGAAGIKNPNVKPHLNNDPQEDYENLQKDDQKVEKSESDDDESVEDYENMGGKDYVNVPPKKSQK